MRIGIDCRLPYYQMGGISQYVLHLVGALADVDVDNEYVLLHSRKDGRSHVPPHGLNFRRRDVWTPCHHTLERWAFSLELLPQRLDVLHSPDFIPPARGARRHVITVHDLNFVFYPQFLTQESRRYYAAQVGWAVERADHIIVDSHATRRDVMEQLGVAAEKVTTIHLAANPLYVEDVGETASDQTLAHFNLPRGFILAVGTLEPRKNYPMLLRAYAQLRKSSSVDVPLVIVGGKGWIYEEIFETIKELGLQEDVHHLQGVPNEQLAHLYHGAGVLVTPSHYEGFGLPALEAQHCGCPVIVSNRGSLPEIVGPGGLLLNPDDVSAWAEMLEQVLVDSALRERLIVNGRLQSKKFSWKKAAEATRQIYQSL